MARLTITRIGVKSWWKHGLLHRTNGPAISDLRGFWSWYQGGYCHSLTGPAVQQSNGRVEYWVNGQQVSEYEHMFINNTHYD